MPQRCLLPLVGIFYLIVPKNNAVLQGSPTTTVTQCWTVASLELDCRSLLASACTFVKVVSACKTISSSCSPPPPLPLPLPVDGARKVWDCCYTVFHQGYKIFKNYVPWYHYVPLLKLFASRKFLKSKNLNDEPAYQEYLDISNFCSARSLSYN